MPEEIYCIDTSSLIHIHREYPEDIFATVWANLSKLADASRLIAPHEVFKEIERHDDDLFKWLKKRKRIFRDLDAVQIKMVTQIEKDFPDLVDWLRESPEADPFVIALAQVQEDKNKSELFQMKHIVVTEESSQRANRIPAVCKHYGIESINVLEFFRREGWKF